MSESKKKIFLLSLGCVKNLVDSENILGLLSSLNYPIVNEVSDSDIIIVNTCGFLQSSVEEAIDVILEVIEKDEIILTIRSKGILHMREKGLAIRFQQEILL